MASIQAGGSHGGKRALDHDIPLVPFIDLLLCCVMFLLVTAVWNRLASVEASLATPGPANTAIDAPPRPRLFVSLAGDHFVVASDAGDRVELAFTGAPDLDALREHLVARHAAGDDRDVTVVADDGVAYESVIATMDVVATAGYAHVTVGDRAL